MHCAMQCSYQIADSMLKIEQCELSAGAAGATDQRANRAPQPGRRATQRRRELRVGQAQFLLQPYCGTAIQFYGAGTSPIAYRGPFSPAQGEASAALQFSGANIYGFQVGPGELKVHLANGVLRTDPLDVTCNQGRVALQPELRMDRQPMEFRLSAGTLASQIQLDQAACRSALKYVVPSVGLGHAVAGPVLDPVGRLPHPHRRLEPSRDRGADHRPFGHDEPRAVGRAVGFAVGRVSLAGSHRARVGDPVPHDRRTDLSPGAGVGVPGRHDADLRLGRPGRLVEADGRNVGAADTGFPATP